MDGEQVSTRPTAGGTDEPARSAGREPGAPAPPAGTERPPAGALSEPASGTGRLARMEPPATVGEARGSAPGLRREAAIGAEPEPVPEPVQVAVNAIPWAVIEIDGREVGETPLARIPLPPGRHRFVARFPDGRVVARDAQVDSENRRFVFE